MSRPLSRLPVRIFCLLCLWMLAGPGRIAAQEEGPGTVIPSLRRIPGCRDKLLHPDEVVPLGNYCHH